MLAKERHAIIMDIMKRTKVIKITDIVRQFDVSNETARRDLEALQDQKLVKRVYGGAVLASPAVFEPQYALRESESHNEKAAIGKAAAAMISEGESVILDIGTTMLEVARNLKGMNNLTVLTNSLPILNELATTNVTLYALGGLLNSDELTMSGNLTINALQNFFVDKAFIGAGGVTMTGGVSGYNNEWMMVTRVILERASEVVLVADSGKFGSNSFSIVCPLDAVDTIVSDSNLPAEYAASIRERKINLVLVEPEEEPQPL